MFHRLARTHPTIWALARHALDKVFGGIRDSVEYPGRKTNLALGVGKHHLVWGANVKGKRILLREHHIQDDSSAEYVHFRGVAKTFNPLRGYEPEGSTAFCCTLCLLG